MQQIRSSFVGLCIIAVLTGGLADVAFAQDARRGRGKPVIPDKVVYDQAQLAKEWAEVQKRYPQFARSHVELQVAVLSAASVYSRLASAAITGEPEEPILIDTREIEHVLSNGALAFGLPTHKPITFFDRTPRIALLIDTLWVTCLSRALEDCTVAVVDGIPIFREGCLKEKIEACPPEKKKMPCVRVIDIGHGTWKINCVPESKLQALWSFP